MVNSMQELVDSRREGLTGHEAPSESRTSKMSDLLHTHPVDTAVHDPNGAVKLHTDPDDHLARLLAPDTDIPWYLSIVESVKEIVSPTKLPPLEVTSKPVAVKDIWGLYQSDPKSRMYSIGAHVGVFALLWFVFSSPIVQKAIKDNVSLIDPNIKPYIPEAKPKQNTMQGGGGGGAREPQCRRADTGWLRRRPPAAA